MNHNDVVTLLQVIAAYDSRTIDRASINAWSEAARRQRWTYADARDAVHEHYARSTAWLMPGHVTELIHAPRRQPGVVSEVLGSAGATPASAGRRAEVMAMVRNLADAKRVPE